MTSVTFPVELGGSGITITDDSNPATGLDGGGHRVRFVPALQGAVDMARHAMQQAQLAGDERAAAQAAQALAQAASALSQAMRDEAAGQVSLASAHAATAGNHAAASASSATAANQAILGLGQFLANGIGIFQTDANGDLIATFDSNVVQSMAINAAGELIVTY